MEEQRKSQPAANAGARRCPQCGAAFTCGIAAANSSSSDVRCWCFDLPPVMPVRADTACLCPNCLARAIREVQDAPKEST
jgi:hypothetical protein